jgi:NAD(P)-dependent dehydrogenase (short-subunit alcohol dehydrogenase family)
LPELEGKVAIVTGGGSGIGRAICEAFALEKARVVIGARNDETGNQTAKAILEDGGTAAFVRTDVRNSAQAKNLVEETVARYGSIDVVCNNAGVDLVRPLLDTTEAEGPFLVSKYALPYMIAKKKGVIINISSQLGVVGFANSSAYCASKGGLILLTKAMALEFARYGIRVNCVCPGAVETPMLEYFFDHLPEPDQARMQHVARHPIGRFGKPEEIAQAALFLASDRSSFITGECLLADGGYVIQ